MENTALLDRILTVEQDIAQSLFDVQIKADKDIAEAMTKGDAELKEKCNRCVLQYNEKLSQAKESMHQEYLSQLQAYEAGLRGINTNKEAFSSLLDKLLFQHSGW